LTSEEIDTQETAAEIARLRDALDRTNQQKSAVSFLRTRVNSGSPEQSASAKRQLVELEKTKVLSDAEMEAAARRLAVLESGAASATRQDRESAGQLDLNVAPVAAPVAAPAAPAAVEPVVAEAAPVAEPVVEAPAAVEPVVEEAAPAATVDTPPMQFGSVPAMKASARQIATEMGLDIADADIDAIVKPATSKSVTKREAVIRTALQARAPATPTAVGAVAPSPAPVEPATPVEPVVEPAAAPATPVEPVVEPTAPAAVEPATPERIDPFEETRGERAARRKEEKSQESLREKVDNINRAIDNDIERASPLEINDAVEAVAESDPLFTDRPTEGAAKQWLKGLKKTDPERAVAVLNAIRSEKDIPPIELPDIVPTRKTSSNTNRAQDEASYSTDLSPYITDFDSAVAAIVKYASNPAQKEVAQKLAARLKQLKAAGFEFSLKITPEGRRLRGARGQSFISYAGLGEATTVEVTLNHPSNGEQSGTGWVVVAHELAHAATQAQIKYAPRGTAAVKLDKLFSDVVAHFNRRAKEGNLTEFEKSIYNRGNNALDSADELLAWGLTSEPMQRWLDSVKSKNGSFLSRLFDVVASALGFSSNDTALSELMSIADELLTETIDTYTEVANKQGQSFGKQENTTGYPSWALSLAEGRPIVWAEKDAALVEAESIAGGKIYLVATPMGMSRVGVGSYTGDMLPPARLKEVQAVAAGMQKTSANVDNTIQAAQSAVTNPFPAANSRFLSVQGAQLNSTSKPMKSKPVRDAVAKVMGTGAGSAAGNAARTVLTWGLPLPALNDYVQSYLSKGDYKLFADAMKRYTETAVKFEGATRQFTDGITAQITRMGEWKLKNADKYAAMTDLYFGGSHARVDLTKPESEYAGNPEKLTAYRKLKKQYDAIGPAGQAIYRQMRVIHNRQFKQISQQVFNRVYDATQDKAMATRIQNEFVKQMREKGPLEGYAPMLRPSGKHMLKYVGKDGEMAFEIFTNPNDQAARRQQLLDDGVSDKDINPFLGSDTRAFDGVVPASFLGQLITTLKASDIENADAKAALIESVMTLGVAMSPSNSVLERLASRKEVAGYIRDPFWAFQEGTIGLGRKLINMEYGAQLNKEVANMEAARKNVGGDATVLSIVEDITKRAKYSANPSQSWWSNLFTTGTYGWTLGFNVSSAIVDLSSLVLVTGPYLTRTYGFAKTHRVMMAAAKDILGMGTSSNVETLVTQGLEGAALQEVLQTLGTKERDMVRRKTLPSVLNIDFNDPAQQKKYGYLKPLVDKVREAGHSERYSELAESAEFGESNPLSKWSARMGFMMNASERFKREVGLKTAYDLELSTLGANPTPEQMAAAAQKAMDMSLLLNGGSTAVTGARFQQQDVARIAFMYRRFAALQMYLQTKTAYDATMNDDPEVKAAARKFAAYTMLTSAAMVGVKGMPMMGAVAGLWAIYGALFGEEDEDNSLENFMRTHLDPILVEGIPNLLFNANVAGRMEMTNLLIRDSNLPNDATLADIVAAHFGGPAYGSVSRAYRGAGLIADGDIQRGVESMLPASFSNLFKSARFLTEGAIETMRGDVVTEISPFGALSQALGFAPADYARTMDFNVGDSNAERRIKTKRTGLYEAVYVAYRVGDTGGVAQAMEKIIEFNARYPEFGITSEGLRQSIKGRDNNTQKMIRGRLPDERMRGNTLERAEDWGF
jgi:hypothetical protein